MRRSQRSSVWAYDDRQAAQKSSRARASSGRRRWGLHSAVDFRISTPGSRLKREKSQWLRLTSARVVERNKPAFLFVLLAAEHVAGRRVHKMRLGARMAPHLGVNENHRHQAHHPPKPGRCRRCWDSCGGWRACSMDCGAASPEKRRCLVLRCVAPRGP